MAKNTNELLRNQMIYCVYTRYFSEEGTFNEVIPQLDRIKKLGTDIIWFLPIYPVGDQNRKGEDGSPYAIKDYRAVNPEFGSMEEFENLVAEIHSRGMKVMIDIVFNHTSPDSLLVKEHPEWFYHKNDGSFGNRVGDWTDIIDLDYANSGLWDYQIETLKFWTKKGIDGFRCDVAPLVPIEFWLEAREVISKINPDHIWLSESIDFGFMKELRDRKLIAHSDSEIYQAFDIAYDYDVRGYFDEFLKGNIKLSRYIDAINQQELIYPANYVKLRNLENHDTDRIAGIVENKDSILQWLAFAFFEKGTSLIYNGQEVIDKIRPSLFDKGSINWNDGCDASEFIAKLSKLKKDIPMEANFSLKAYDQENTILATYALNDIVCLGIFSVKGYQGSISVPLADGSYINALNGEGLHVTEQKLEIDKNPIWIQL